MGDVSDFLKPSGRANGLAFDVAGKLYACQGGEHRLVRFDPRTRARSRSSHRPTTANRSTVRTTWHLMRSAASTSPDPHYGKPEDQSQKIMGVYYVDAKGELSRVIDNLKRPNGILVSPDGQAAVRR